MTEASLKAHFPGRTRWSGHATCSLEVSVNNERQKGPYLAAQVALINQTFQHCLIRMGDTLFRHNLFDTQPPEEAWENSKKMGDAWIEDNRKLLDALTVPLTIIRWDESLSQPGFPTIHAGLRDLYNKAASFRQAVNQDVAAFTRRNPDANPERCTDYLLEEAAADIAFCRLTRVSRIYPGKELNTYAYLSRPNIPEELKGLETSPHIHVSFHRKKQSLQPARERRGETQRTTSDRLVLTGFNQKPSGIPVAQIPPENPDIYVFDNSIRIPGHQPPF